MRPPKGFTLTESYVDWIGNTVVDDDIVLIGQRDGNGSRMWIGQVVAVAEHRIMSKHYSVLIQPLSVTLYSPHSFKHSWKLKRDWDNNVVHDAQGRPVYEDKKPRPTWTKADFVVKYPKEFLPEGLTSPAGGVE